MDVNDIMSKGENEEEVVHSVSIDLEGSSSAIRKNTRPSKNGEKQGMISSIKKVVESMKEFVEVTKKKTENKKKMEIKEAREMVHEVVKRKGRKNPRPNKACHQHNRRRICRRGEIILARKRHLLVIQSVNMVSLHKAPKISSITFT